ncbi:MAG: hypothetical protein DSY88_09805 [Candidatus Poseidoniales archaeon]|nr:MAG: hypothetical protein DSY88_09805 [Candidatus Poseidoniales archaeon]
MRFGMFDVVRWHQDVSAEKTLTDILDQIEFADQLGIQDIWLGEHHFSRHGLLSGIFSFMGAVAAKTKNARIGTSIVILPFHNPVQVAEEAATLDILSNGRFNLGVGAGYQAQEFLGMGVDITQSRKMFKEHLDVVMKCWEDGPTTYKGDYVDIEDIWVIPKPIQKPGPPIYIAVSTSPESVDYAASIGVPILVGGPTTTIGQTPRVVQMWHERMEHYGRPHEHIDLPVSASVYVAPTMEEAENDIKGLEAQINEEFYRIGNPADKDGNIPENYKHWVHRDRDRQLAAERAREEGIRPLVGTPEVVCERIEILRSKGIKRIFGKFGAAGLDPDKTMRCIEMFANQVMPEFAEEPVSATS